MNPKQIIELVENMNGEQVQLIVIDERLKINVIGVIYDIGLNRFSIVVDGNNEIAFQKDSITSIQLNVGGLNRINYAIKR